MCVLLVSYNNNQMTMPNLMNPSMNYNPYNVNRNMNTHNNNNSSYNKNNYGTKQAGL